MKKSKAKSGKPKRTAPPERAPPARAPSARAPTAEEVAALVGIALMPRMSPDQIQRMRRGLPGYVGLLDDVAHQYDDDGDQLALPGVSSAELLAMQSQQQHLAAREGVVEAVHRSAYEQRLATDDRAMATLQRIARRVNALREDDPGLAVRWKFLLDFLGVFRPGRAKKRPASSDPKPTE
jgi:hypothetical protein